MAKQAYLSMSDIFWDTLKHPEFEKLKTGYIGNINSGSQYEIVSGIPKTAKLTMVIYVFEDESLPDIPGDELFDQLSTTIKTRTLPVQ